MERIRRELRGAAAALFECADRKVLIEGPGGTGKTQAVLTKIHYRAWKYPRSRHLIARATRASMTESVLKTWEENILGAVHPAYSGSAKRKNRHSYDFPNGSTVVVGGLDEGDRYFSTEWDTIYCAEASEISEDQFEKLGRAMRNFKTPYHQCIADVNPTFPGNWLNRAAMPCSDGLRLVKTIDDYNRLQAFNRSPLNGRMRRLISRHQDNPFFWDLSRWAWTPEGESYVLGELANMTGYRRVRLFEGLWIAGEGTVFPEFNTSKHIVSPFTWPNDWPVLVGVDPGFDHPCAILWIGIAPNGALYVIDELYRGGKSISEHAADIKEHNPGRTIRDYLADPQQAFSSTAQSPRTIADQFRDSGLNFHQWPRSIDKEAMVNAVREYLKNEKLKVFSTCVNTIMEFQSWSFKRNAKGELPSGDDQYEDRNNHAMDVLTGIVSMRPQFESAKMDVVVRR